MPKKTKKIKKTVWFSPETLAAISAYQEVTEEDFSNTVETLVVKSFDNINAVEQMQNDIKNRLKKIEEAQTKNTDRLVFLIIGVARIVGRIYAHTFKTYKSVSNEEGKAIKELEGYGIKEVMPELKWKHKNKTVEEELLEEV